MRSIAPSFVRRFVFVVFIFNHCLHIPLSFMPNFVLSVGSATSAFLGNFFQVYWYSLVYHFWFNLPTLVLASLVPGYSVQCNAHISLSLSLTVPPDSICSDKIEKFKSHQKSSSPFPSYSSSAFSFSSTPMCPFVQ